MNKLNFLVIGLIFYANIIAAQDDLTASAFYLSKSTYNILNYREIKELPKFYSGLVVEIIQSNEPISSKSPIFNRFGKKYVDKSENFSYLILTEFESENSAKKYYQEIILPYTKAARLFRYKEGERFEIK